MELLLQDFRFAARQLIRSPGFAVVAILTLGLGIGANAAIFSVVNGVLLRPLPYPEPDEIVRVFQVGEHGGRGNFSDPNFADIYERSRSFRGIAQFQWGVASVSGASEPSRTVYARVSRDFFRVMGAQPLLGRGFVPEEQREGGARSVVVSHGYWQRYLDGDPDFARRSLRFDDELHSVVGVMPPGFDFPGGADLWVPRELAPLNTSRTAHNWQVVGRLVSAAALGPARAELSGIAASLKSELGDDTWMSDAALVPLHEFMVGSVRPALLLLLGAAGFLLLIACANVVNILLARAAARQRELAVRVALGAGRGRLARQFLTEALLLSLLGGAVGVLVASWGVSLLLASGSNLPRVNEIGVDGTVLVFALAVSLVTAAALGLFAAWRATGEGVRGALAGTRRTRAGGGNARLRGALVVSQVGLTLVLLIGAGLLGRSFLSLLDVDPGFRTSGAVVMNLSLPWQQGGAEQARLASFHEELITRLEALPGMEAVGGVSSLPLASNHTSGMFVVVNHPDEIHDFESFRQVAQDAERVGYAEFRVASEGYFQAMSIPLLRGRLFERGDFPDAGQHVAVISESLAAAQWPDADPLGKMIQFGNMDGNLTPFTVVGIVGDVREAGLEAEPRPTFYGYYRQRPSSTATFALVLQGGGDAGAVISQARAVVRELNPELPPSFRTLEQNFAGALAERRFNLFLLGVFGGAALLLALIGIYGVMSFNVAQRTREIGVRMALGAPAASVLRLVVGQGLLLTTLGIALGLAGALGATRLMSGLLYGVTTTDAVTYISVSLLLVGVALLAALLPARRATRVDPVVALRAE